MPVTAAQMPGPTALHRGESTPRLIGEQADPLSLQRDLPISPETEQTAIEMVVAASTREGQLV